MLNPILWQKIQGQKHPVGWGIVEHQIPSIKVLFTINAKSHKHPCIKPLSSESKRQLVNRRKQKVAFNQETAHCPEIRSYIMWWGAPLTILNDTPVACTYSSYNRTHVKNAYICILTQSFWMGTTVIRRKHIIQPPGFGACSSTSFQWDGEDVPVPWERWNSHPPVQIKKSCVNQFI